MRKKTGSLIDLLMNGIIITSNKAAHICLLKKLYG